MLREEESAVTRRLIIVALAMALVPVVLVCALIAPRHPSARRAPPTTAPLRALRGPLTASRRR